MVDTVGRCKPTVAAPWSLDVKRCLGFGHRKHLGFGDHESKNSLVAPYNESHCNACSAFVGVGDVW